MAHRLFAQALVGLAIVTRGGLRDTRLGRIFLWWAPPPCQQC